MRYKFLLATILSFSCIQLTANAHSHCSRDENPRVAHKGTVLSPKEDDYDVVHVKLDISLDNANTNVSGNAITTAKVTRPDGITEYAFELNTNMTIDSVLVNGVLSPTANPSSYLRITTLPDTIHLNSLFSVQVFYHGTAVNGSGFFNGGVIQRTLTSGTKIVYTMSDDYYAKDWWPAKQSLLDKIDSADIWVTVPPNTKAGATGLLKAITPMGLNNRYEWKTKYPVDYYLMSVAVAPYVEHTQTVHFSSSSDTMLVQHFMYDTLSTNSLYRAKLDSVTYMIDHFSTLFGRYPFWKEKYGHCMAPLSGGMEHQTMTTLGAFETPLIAHELGHQWWGDAVTYSSWRDIWMSEGWATYCEQLYIEKFRGTAAAKTYRTATFNRVMASLGGTTYVYDTTNVSRTFDARLTYDKGAAIAHMLRYVAPDDNAFFTGLKNYQQQYAFKTANTEQFKDVMEAAYGYDLDTFFNQWVYKEGYPIYSIRWNQAGNLIALEITQSSSRPASVGLFRTPVDIKILSTTGDTTIRFTPTQNVQFIYLTWNQAIDVLAIDPDNQILNKEGNIAREAYLSVRPLNLEDLKIAPNPTRDTWQVTGVPEGAVVRLFNINGALVWEQKHQSGAMTVPAANLPAGQYELVIAKDRQSAARKLVKM